MGRRRPLESLVCAQQGQQNILIQFAILLSPLHEIEKWLVHDYGLHTEGLEFNLRQWWGTKGQDGQGQVGWFGDFP